MKLVFLILAFFAAPAFAVGIGNDNPPGGGGGNQLQMQTQGQIQGQAQSANADSRARAMSYVAGSTVNVTPAPVSLTVNEAAPPAYTTQHIEQGTLNVRSVPNVFAGNVYPTAPCMGSSTVGAAALGWGASVGTSWADDECGVRETARSFQNLGLTTDAIAVLCSSKYAAVAPICQGAKQ